MKLILGFTKKTLMRKFLFLLSSFILATIALTSQSFAALTEGEEQMMIFGMFSALCEMHDENNLPDSIAKKYVDQYSVNAVKKLLSKSEMELIKSTVLELYPSCPFPKQ